MADVSTSSEGYYRDPTLSKNQIVFVSEDDLWTIGVSGGVARRLTSGLGKATHPSLSRDGKHLAYASTEEGHTEVYVMSSDGGLPKRMTHFGCETRVIGWTPENEVLFASNHQHAFARLTDIYTLNVETREIKKVPCGPATHADLDASGQIVLARHGGTDLAYWKRYKGGRAGELWIGDVKGNFHKLLDRPVNAARPFWVGDRIYFISDFEGMGNVYSVKPDGTDLHKHTAMKNFYARGLSVSGETLVFHSGGDLFKLDLMGSSKTPVKVEIDYRSPQTQTNRRYVFAQEYLEDYELDPKAKTCIVAARGKTFSFDLWKGPVRMHGQEGALRYRLGRFMSDGRRIALISDAGGEEAIEIHDVQDRTLIERLKNLDLGRSREMKISPVSDFAAITNHRNELILVDLEKHTAKVLDRSPYARIWGFNWSPDGRHIAYAASINERQLAIKVCKVETGEIFQVTNPVLNDVSPYFDPLGEYLYFLSYRELDPVYDNLHFDLGFPRGCKPHLVTLRKGVLPPFHPDYEGRAKDKDEKDNKDNGENGTKKAVKNVDIDFDGIQDRIVALPMVDGRYGQIMATKDKILFTRLPIKGSLRNDWYSKEPSSDASLESYDLNTEKFDTLVSNLTSFKLSKDGKHVLFRVGNTLRMTKAGEKPRNDSDDYKRGGWIDLNRVEVPIRPRAEWRQMYREAWRLQRDHFWTEDMSKVNWVRVYDRYLPLLERVNSRSEVSDVIWEMQGELGTSHAYEIGGDYRQNPDYGIGFLGAESTWSEDEQGYVLTRVMKGDLWDDRASSPLARAGLELREGDVLVSLDGQRLSKECAPAQTLVHRAGRDVIVGFRRKGSSDLDSRSVRTLRSEQKLRYREWVEGNRRWVHEQSKGKVGYIHVPNMGPYGYSEFHRAFLTELDRDGLIVDVRFNGGGHVSQLLLEKLGRKRIGYSKSRWFGVEPFPQESPAGAMVCLTNEYAGSDGDIFSHSFKLLGLGPLIGKRTWGGVIGISPSHSLVDGGMTTQPEYSFWFSDVGWQVENYGTEPDLEVEYGPSAYVSGIDPQLETSLKTILRSVGAQKVVKPRMDDGPDLSLPWSEEGEGLT